MKRIGFERFYPMVICQMTSSQVNKDLETLLSMEIKMRILDTEGIPIPPEAPEIPPAPDNYDFAYLNL